MTPGELVYEIIVSINIRIPNTRLCVIVLKYLSKKICADDDNINCYITTVYELTTADHKTHIIYLCVHI